MQNKEKARERQVTECHLYNASCIFFSKMICYQNLFQLQKPMLFICSHGYKTWHDKKWTLNPFTNAHLPDIVLVTKLKKGREI